MKAKIEDKISSEIFEAVENLHRANVNFLDTMLNLSEQHPEECLIDDEEKKYVNKKLTLLHNAIEVIGLYRVGKCDAANCHKALDLIDEQIDILEGVA